MDVGNIMLKGINSVLSDIIKNLKETNDNKDYDKSIESKKGIYIFISFDLVNSTLFKSRHMKKWPKFISSFYETVMSQFAVGRFRESSRNVADDEMQRTGGFHLWKLIGDEVLLYHKVVSKEELYKTILHINDKRTKLIEESINRYAELNPQENKEECRHLFYQYFEVKTTVWIGSCAGAAEKVSADYPNLVYDSMTYSNEDTDSNSQLDFLGPDIDEGFRLCAYAEKRQMIVSPKLVYLLLLAYENNVDNINVFNLNFRIVNYVAMKGVWENRLYPIIMFCQCDLDKKTALDQWKNIYVDIVRKEEMLSMLEVFREQEKSLKELTPYTNGLWKKKPKFEFHISCLCYDKKQNKFWIANHPSHGWSFGCTQITQNTNYFEYVSQIYLKKYGLQIQIDDSNHILSFYSVNRDATSEIILGVVILVTEVEEKEQISGIDAQWITYEETKKLQGNKLVNFDQIVNKAQNCVAEIAAI